MVCTDPRMVTWSVQTQGWSHGTMVGDTLDVGFYRAVTQHASTTRGRGMEAWRKFLYKMTYKCWLGYRVHQVLGVSDRPPGIKITLTRMQSFL